MTRPIEFRAWEEKTKTMCDWNCMRQTAFNSINVLAAAERFEESGRDHKYLHFSSWFYNVFNNPDIVLEQFTGLLDKNGVKVFEGDIIKSEFFDGYGVVIFNENNTSFCVEINDGIRFYSLCCSLAKGCVAGNIHQNPELLK